MNSINFYSSIIDLYCVTLGDCLGLFTRNRMTTIINDGHIIGFECERGEKEF